MHCILTADLAALISQHGPAILHGREAVPPSAVTDYWASSRNRFDLWNQAMMRFRCAEKSGHLQLMRQWWQDHIVVLEEVLVSELLTRVIAALAAGMEDESEDEEISPVTHAIHLTHLEARNRVQQIMLRGRGCSVPDAVRLNRLRQAVERWTDALIGRMSVDSPDSVRYATDPSRAEEYAWEMRSCGHGPSRNTASWLMNAAMHDTLRRRSSDRSALPESNRAVARSVMLMLRPDLFDSVGVLKSLWLHRLQSNTERTDRVLDELISPDLDEATTAEGMETTHGPPFHRWYL
jgi:hypothetical protein